MLKFDRSYWSDMAEGVAKCGWDVAVISYPLAPSVLIAEITESVRKAVFKIGQTSEGPLRLIGHSAIGHLATRMVCSVAHDRFFFQE